MKHVKKISAAPARAQDITVGAVLSVIGQIISVVASALVQKEEAQV